LVVRISSSDFCKSPVDLVSLSKAPEVEEEERDSENGFRGGEYGGDSNE
jgi:hypothetical protein